MGIKRLECLFHNFLLYPDSCHPAAQTRLATMVTTSPSLIASEEVAGSTGSTGSCSSWEFISASWTAAGAF